MAKYDYDAYGAVREQNGQRFNSFKYVAQVGHPTDEETELIYMRARYYEPVTGRFISEDPARSGVNWYLYDDGNPVGRMDVEGKQDFSWWAAMWVLSGRSFFAQRALEDFVGLPLDPRWGQRLVEVSNPTRRALRANTDLNRLIRILESLGEISREFALLARLGTTRVRAIASYTFMLWVGIVRVEIAFEEGI